MDIPFKGRGLGVFNICLSHRGDRATIALPCQKEINQYREALLSFAPTEEVLCMPVFNF
jgi:hypothetical protein